MLETKARLPVRFSFYNDFKVKKEIYHKPLYCDFSVVISLNCKSTTDDQIYDILTPLKFWNIKALGLYIDQTYYPNHDMG